VDSESREHDVTKMDGTTEEKRLIDGPSGGGDDILNIREANDAPRMQIRPNTRVLETPKSRSGRQE
jgi:hypothetical protein